MLGERLRKLRKEKGLTQEYVSKILGVGERTIGYYESEERNPDPNAIVKLANFFDVSTDYLLGQTQCKKPCHENRKHIDGIIQDVIKYLKESEGLLLEGKPVDEIAIDRIISAMKIGLEMAKHDS